MSLQRCKRETTSTEFVKWMGYLERDANAFHRGDYYLAQIALEVRRIFAKHPNKYKLKDFILKFKANKPKPMEEKKLSIKQRTDKMLAFFKGFVEGK